jgi:CarboxypepD_reg-like domain
MLKKISYILFGFLLFTTTLQAQLHNARNTEESDIIQFSGVVVTADSLDPIAFAGIQILGTYRGTVADYYGFFSIVARKGETVVFSCMGYEKAYYKIPDTLSGNRYTLFQVMAKDTIMLTETVVYPWPSREQFKEAFLQLEIPYDDYDRAMDNLELMAIKERAEQMGWDASMNYRDFVNDIHYQASYLGQMQPNITGMVNNPLLNPLAWAKLIKAWKEGKFKRKKYKH